MGTYLDYSIEFSRKGKSFFVTKSQYEDTDIVNPYILKHAFADFLEDCPEKVKSIESSDIANPTEDTLHIFSNKIPRVESSIFTFTKINPEAANYPYKYKPKYHIEYFGKQPGLKSTLINILKNFSENLQQSRRDTLLGIDLQGFDKYIDKISPYLVPEVSNEESLLEMRRTKSLEEIVKNNKIENLKQINNEYFLLLNTPFEALHYLVDYTAFQKIEFEELFTGSIGQVYYMDTNVKPEKEVPQFMLSSEVNYFELLDVKNLLKYLKKKLSDMQKSTTVDNLVKDRISTVLSEHSEDSNTEIYKSLEKYVEDLKIVYCEDLIEETKYQLKEVIKLYNFMKKLPKEPRIVWKIF